MFLISIYNFISSKLKNVLPTLHHTDNEVDGMALLALTQEDIFSMFPGKVGLARKLSTLVKRLHCETVQVGTNINI